MWVDLVWRKFNHKGHEGFQKGAQRDVGSKYDFASLNLMMLLI
jgi:hypothetical protein